MDASGRRLAPQAVIPLVVRTGKTLMRTIFFRGQIPRRSCPFRLRFYPPAHWSHLSGVRLRRPRLGRIDIIRVADIEKARPKTETLTLFRARGALQNKAKVKDRVNVDRARTIPPGERAAVLVTAPV